MPNIMVVPAEKSKFKILINYIQRGIEYSSREYAEHEADKLRKEFK